jgi:hypothetical protein
VRSDCASLEPRPPEERVTLVAVRDARVLPDGRVGAIVVQQAASFGTGPVFVVFVANGDRWVVDGSIQIADAVPVGSPAAD